MRLYDLKALGRQLGNYLDAKRGQLWQRFDFDAEAPGALGREHRLQSQVISNPRLYDGYDSSRQGVALYASEGKPQDPYRVELEVAHLRAGAERNYLDTSFELSWAGKVWNTRVDHNGQAYHNNLHQRVQLEVDKQDLRKMGWSDGQPLKIQVTTHPEGKAQACSQLTATTDVAEKEPVFRWEGKTIYYAVTDRFHNGDTSNDQGCNPKDPQKFHGGDWKGLTAKLDYLEEMKVDALWISCPYLNQRDFFGSDGFHGYWPKEFDRPEPSFGRSQDLKELIDQAHERGIKVILDVVLNHTSYDHPLKESKPEWFHHNGNIAGKLQWQMENGSLAGLPDLDQDNPEVKEYLNRVHQDWLGMGFDGFRLDAVRHVPEPFLRQFNETMKAQNPDYFSVGEAFWQDANFVAGYQNRTTDSMFDFPLAYAIREVFAGDPTRTPEVRQQLANDLQKLNDQEAERMLRGGHKSLSMTHLSRIFERDGYYDNPGKLATLIDNHDMVRFMSDTGGDLRKQEIALAFLYAVRGTPCVYYGTEVAMEGFGVDNRNDMQWDLNPQLREKFVQLVEVRKSSEALQFGTQVERLATEKTYALSRVRADEEVVVVFNNSDQEQEIEVPLAHLKEQPEYQEMLSGLKGSLSADGKLAVQLPAKGYAFYQFAPTASL